MSSHSIRRHFFPQCCVLLCVLLCASACSLRSVRVVQERQFKTMCAHLRPEMLRRSLLDEQGNYLASPLPALPSKSDCGENLFRQLSPSFRYSADNPMAAPKTFAESAASRRDVHIRDYGFTLKQGLDTVDLDLIARSDWEGDGRQEWLLACKVTFGSTPVHRTYYLALPSLEAEGALTARLLAVFECMAYDCGLYLPQAGEAAYLPETPVIEAMPGQRAVTSPTIHPPAAGSHQPGVSHKRGF